MATIKRYADFALQLDGDSVPFEQGSLELGNDFRSEDIKSGSELNFQLRQVLGKKPFIRATLLDPSLVSAWGVVAASGGDFTDFIGVWRQFEENAAFSTTYLSAAIAKGVIMPVSLQGTVERKATMEVVCHGIFDSGAAVAIGSTSVATAAVTAAYYPTHIIIGATTVVELKSINVNWEYQLQDDEQLEPAYYYYDQATMRGNAVLKDLAQATAARVEDSTKETITVEFTDANNALNKVTLPLGTCHITANMRGDEATIDFAKLG